MIDHNPYATLGEEESLSLTQDAPPLFLRGL